MLENVLSGIAHAINAVSLGSADMDTEIDLGCLSGFFGADDDGALNATLGASPRGMNQLPTIVYELGGWDGMSFCDGIVRGYAEDAWRDLSALEQESLVSDWIAQLQARLDSAVTDGKIYTCFVRRDSERNLYFPVVKLLSHGVESETEYHHEFFGSGEYRSLCELGEKITGLIEEGGYVERGEKRCETRSFYEVFDWLMAEAARGYNIQRYKGLGEMNPDQLWKTTMDPESRTILQVQIEDGAIASNLFDRLMGDEVQPRREFIEKNAKYVKNLDI